jgi:hypothetical protein
VQVDAVVTDKTDRPVTDLTAEDFIILQDGKPQKITNFSLVRLRDPDIPRPIAKKQAEKTGKDSPPPIGPDKARPGPASYRYCSGRPGTLFCQHNQDSGSSQEMDR